MSRLQIAPFLQAHGLKQSKNLGQHFLIDERVLQKIVEAAEIQPTDHIVEIGAGIGILTKELLKRVAKVTTIELDARLIPLLKEFVEESNFQYVNILKAGPGEKQKPPRSSLTITHGDALKVSFPEEPYKIVANIPYQITSPLLHHAFVGSRVRPTSLTLLIQKEVAEKIISAPLRSAPLRQGFEGQAGASPFAKASEDRSEGRGGNRLSILVQLFGEPRIVLRVPPSAFLPQPKVHSAVIHIRCFEKPLANETVLENVFRLTDVAFQGKRKMLRGTIGKRPGGMELLARAKIETTRRPETLTIEEWLALAQRVH